MGRGSCVSGTGGLQAEFSLMEQSMAWSHPQHDSPAAWFALVLGAEQKMSLARVRGPAPEAEMQFVLCLAGAGSVGQVHGLLLETNTSG